MQGRPPTQVETDAAADAAAAASDAAAEAAARANPTPPSQEPEVVELPPGPALTADDLEARLVRLASAIKQPADTEPAQVARTLGLPMKPSNHSEITGIKGPLEAGAYEVEVMTLYRAAPGKHVSIRVEPTKGPGCPLRFNRLRDALTAATHYELSKGLRFLEPYQTFSSAIAPDLNIFIRLETDSHDAPECVKHVTFDLEKADGTPKD